MTDKTGGPAFHVPNQMMAEQYGSMGMTLRDYFAAKAMQAIIQNDPSFAKEVVNLTVKDAYAYADAMLEAREV